MSDGCTSRDELQKLLEELHAECAVNTRERLVRLEEAAAEHDGRASIEVMACVHSDLHHFAGSGAMFGFPDLSRRARVLELAMQRWRETDAMPEEAEWKCVVNGIGELWKAIERQEPPAPLDRCPPSSAA